MGKGESGAQPSQNEVGPVLKSGEIADAAIRAVHEDNPSQELIVEDHVAYVRIKAEHECLIRRQTMEEHLGRPFQMAELEMVLASFAGQIETTPQYMRFYFDKTL